MQSTAGRGVGAAALVVVMAIGSVAMWIGVPVFWLWLGSRIVSSSEPSMGIYLLVLVGIVASMAALGKGLGWINRVHMTLVGTLPTRREQTIWLKSMRGDAAKKRDHGILANVMAVSVGVALVIFGAWFLFFSAGTGGGI